MVLTLMAGTGVVAQAGAWILAAIVWGAVFSNDLILFSAHPVGLLLVIHTCRGLG